MEKLTSSTVNQLPERLELLDRELKTERTKHFEYLTAVRGDLRIRVCVTRACERERPFTDETDFVASASFGGKVFRCLAGSPSRAWSDLMHKLTFAIRRPDRLQRKRVTAQA